MFTGPTSDVLRDVLRERSRQDEKWGPSAERPVPPLSVLVEEVGEVAKAMQDIRALAPPRSLRVQAWVDAWLNLREELVQVAAVAVAMVEGMDRGDRPDG